MRPNVGRTDRIIRIVVGLLLLPLAIIGPQTAWAYLALIPLFTGVFGYCPLYDFLNISTFRASKTARDGSAV